MGSMTFGEFLLTVWSGIEDVLDWAFYSAPGGFTSLVLGIVGLVVVGNVLGIVVRWIVGSSRGGQD